MSAFVMLVARLCVLRVASYELWIEHHSEWCRELVVRRGNSFKLNCDVVFDAIIVLNLRSGFVAELLSFVDAHTV